MARAKGKMPPRDPGVAGVLSFLLPGLGQIYVGQVARGFVHFALHLISVAAFLGTILGFAPVAAPGADASLGNALLNSASVGVLAALVAVVNWVLSVMSAMARAFFSAALDRSFAANEPEATVRVRRVSSAPSAVPGGTAASTAGETETAASSEPVPQLQREPSLPPSAAASPAPQPTLSSFSRALYELLEFRNMREEDLVRLSGLDGKEIRSLLDGAPPDERQLGKLADALDVSVELLKSYA